MAPKLRRVPGLRNEHLNYGHSTAEQKKQHCVSWTYFLMKITEKMVHLFICYRTDDPGHRL